MEVLVNERLVSQRAKLGRITSIAGLAVLAGGLVASFNPQYVYLSFAALIVGFILSQIGSFNTIRWARRPRADEILAKSLKGLDRKSRFYNYFLPASHVLVTSTGVFVFVVKPQTGQIRYSRGRWRQKLTFSRILLFFGQQGLGNPSLELDLEMKKLLKYITEKKPELNPTIRGAVVFSDPRVELELEEPQVPVLRPKQVKPFVRRPLEEQGYLGGPERRELIELFDAAVE